MNFCGICCWAISNITHERGLRTWLRQPPLAGPEHFFTYFNLPGGCRSTLPVCWCSSAAAGVSAVNGSATAQSPISLEIAEGCHWAFSFLSAQIMRMTPASCAPMNTDTRSNVSFSGPYTGSSSQSRVSYGATVLPDIEKSMVFHTIPSIVNAGPRPGANSGAAYENRGRRDIRKDTLPPSAVTASQTFSAAH